MDAEPSPPRTSGAVAVRSDPFAPKPRPVASEGADSLALWLVQSVDAGQKGSAARRAPRYDKPQRPRGVESSSSGEEEDAGPLDPASCTVTGAGVAGGEVGRPARVVVTARDEDGRRVKVGGACVRVTLAPSGRDAGPAAGGVDRPSTAIEVDARDKGDGTYEASVTALDRGNYKLSVTVDGLEPRDSPFPVFFAPPEAGGGAESGPAGGGSAAAAAAAALSPLASLALRHGVSLNHLARSTLERSVLLAGIPPAASALDVAAALGACGAARGVAGAGAAGGFALVEFDLEAGVRAASAAPAGSWVVLGQPISLASAAQVADELAEARRGDIAGAALPAASPATGSAPFDATPARLPLEHLRQQRAQAALEQGALAAQQAALAARVASSRLAARRGADAGRAVAEGAAAAVEAAARAEREAADRARQILEGAEDDDILGRSVGRSLPSPSRSDRRSDRGRREEERSRDGRDSRRSDDRWRSNDRGQRRRDDDRSRGSDREYRDRGDDRERRGDPGGGSRGGDRDRHESSRGGDRDRRDGSRGGDRDRRDGSRGGDRDRRDGSRGGDRDCRDGSRGGDRDRRDGSRGGDRDRRGDRRSEGGDGRGPPSYGPPEGPESSLPARVDAERSSLRRPLEEAGESREAKRRPIQDASEPAVSSKPAAEPEPEAPTGDELDALIDELEG